MADSQSSRKTSRSGGTGRAAGARSPTTVARITRVPRLARRRDDAHKGDFGRVLIIGGSRGMIGAPALAANAALRAGAGLVTVACPASIQLAVATLCPCATTIPLPEDRAGLLRPMEAARALSARGTLRGSAGDVGEFDVVAAGPGLGRGDDAFNAAWLNLLRLICKTAARPLVLDADGLNALPVLGGGDAVVRTLAECGLHRAVLTPHPGEMARLRGVTASDVQKSRERIAIDTARMLSTARAQATAGNRAIVLLKGAGTVVTDGWQLYVNRSGNPGMATGGSGDVLTGVVAALVGQGLSRFDAAVLGAHVHGRAGDLAAAERGRVGMTASDLLEFLPAAFMALR